MTNFKNLYNLKKTQILITGANGQIGLSLLKNSRSEYLAIYPRWPLC